MDENAAFIQVRDRKGNVGRASKAPESHWRGNTVYVSEYRFKANRNAVVVSMEIVKGTGTCGYYGFSFVDPTTNQERGQVPVVFSKRLEFIGLSQHERRAKGCMYWSDGDAAACGLASTAKPSAKSDERSQLTSFTKAQKREIQRWLTSLGYDTKGVDGVLGSNSRAAIRRWQKDRNLPITGMLTEAQFQKLARETR